MEYGQYMNSAGKQDNLAIIAIDQSNHSSSNDDVMIRRMKNRERQRRYRARKRLEADMKKSSIVNPPTTPKVEPEVNTVRSLGNFVSRVYCKRNWKKDARRAFALKAQENTADGSVKPAVILSTESQTLPNGLPNSNTVETTLGIESHLGTNKVKPGRRDWKAEARNKKA